MSDQKLDGYSLTRQWFDFAFENPRKVKPVHCALYLWCVEKNNRLGWIQEFQLPTDEGMAAIGVQDKETFLKALKDLAAWGAVIVTQESKNIYTARYITLRGCKLAAEGCLDNVLSRPINSDAKKDAKTAATTPPKPTTAPKAKPATKPAATPTNNKPKTPKPKKPKTADPLLFTTGDETKLFNAAKKIFERVYIEKCQSGEYYFQALDGAKLKSILKQIMFKVKEKNPTNTEGFTLAEMEGAAEFYFAQAYDAADVWLKANYNLSNLQSKFNNIYTSIKNANASKKNGSGNNKAASANGVIDAINQRFNPGPDDATK